MILEILKYYAQFPRRERIEELFARGRSEYPEYATLLHELRDMPAHSRIEGLEHYVFGQSFDTVKQRVDALLEGTYLFVEIGEISSARDARNNIHDEVQMAVTIAAKAPETDIVEEAILSHRTLEMITQLRLAMLTDCRSTPWLREISPTLQLRPFVTKEFASVGWTLLFERSGADLFELKSRMPRE